MARKGGSMGRSGKVAPNPKYTFATDEEVGNRDMTTYQPTPTSFQQIGPSDRGGNANEPDRRHIGGSSPSKFDDIP
jgi:hypothetical protein